MLFDTGQLGGEEGKKALADFDKLGPESIPALIRGINRAAVMENSCPTLVIAKKLSRMLAASDDDELLDFAHDNIAAGVDHSQHMRVLQDLRVMCMLRRNALLRLAERTGIKAPHKMTTAELADAMTRDSGNRLKMELMELGQRKGPDVLTGLVAAAGNKDQDVQKLALDLLTAQMGTQGIEVVQTEMRDEHIDARLAAARAAAKFTSLAGDLIGLLADPDPDVAAAAHQSLVKISGGEDYGPAVGVAAGGRGGPEEVAGVVGQGAGQVRAEGRETHPYVRAGAPRPPLAVTSLKAFQSAVDVRSEGQGHVYDHSGGRRRCGDAARRILQGGRRDAGH